MASLTLVALTNSRNDFLNLSNSTFLTFLKFTNSNRSFTTSAMPKLTLLRLIKLSNSAHSSPENSFSLNFLNFETSGSNNIFMLLQYPLNVDWSSLESLKLFRSYILNQSKPKYQNNINKPSASSVSCLLLFPMRLCLYSTSHKSLI